MSEQPETGVDQIIAFEPITLEEIKVEHSGSVEHEHEVSLISLLIVLVIVWAPFWWYDTEIRCALGNQKSCATLKVDPPKATP